MNLNTPTDREWQILWDIITVIRDAYPRNAQDADSAEIVDEILAYGFRLIDDDEPRDQDLFTQEILEAEMGIDIKESGNEER